MTEKKELNTSELENVAGGNLIDDLKAKDIDDILEQRLLNKEPITFPQAQPQDKPEEPIQIGPFETPKNLNWGGKN